MHDGKAALATDPLPRLGQDAGVVKHGRLVQQDTSAVDGPRKWHLIGVKVLESRLSSHLVGLVAQDVIDGVGCEENVGIGCEV